MTNPALLSTVLPALSPCPHLDERCSGAVQWRPEHGFIPRGFAGATGTLQAVRLVLVSAEPSDPADGESYGGGAERMAHDHLRLFEIALAGGGLRPGGLTTPYHRNLRRLLSLCWPDLSIGEQLERTWMTNAVLCSAPKPSGPVPKVVEVTCGRAYLVRQLDLLPHAFILALGDKAGRRLHALGIRIDAGAQHPSARPNTNPEDSWGQAAHQFRSWLASSPDTRRPPALSAAAPRPHAASEGPTSSQPLYAGPALRGQRTPEDIDRYRRHYPKARIRKLVSASCTNMMKQKNRVGGPRYTIFEHFDGEPFLEEAIQFAKAQGMTVGGGRAYWDILEGLRRGYIEVSALGS